MDDLRGPASLSRRALLGSIVAAAAYGLVGCAGEGRLVQAEVARAPLRADAAEAAVTAVAAFSRDLLAAVADGGNLVCSPYSVLVALAMVRQGATGTTAREMDQTLHLPELSALNAGLNAVTQTLATRSGRRRNADGGRATVGLEIADQVWGQQGLAWGAPFLEALASCYGTGVREADFARAEDARREVNDWVADATADRIPELMGRGTITADTRLVLVNALHLLAPWHDPFVSAGRRPFSSGDGQVDAPMMATTLSEGALSGRGWQAARVPLAGRELALTVVLPSGTVGALLDDLRGPDLLALLRGPADRSVRLTLPTFTFRSTFALSKVLGRLGMPTAFTDSAEFPGLTTDEQLYLTHVEHQGWIAVDEQGLEAAAATGVTAEAVSAQVSELELVLDRPFLYVVHDVALGLPLLLGVVANPLAITA